MCANVESAAESSKRLGGEDLIASSQGLQVDCNPSSQLMNVQTDDCDSESRPALVWGLTWTITPKIIPQVARDLAPYFTAHA